MTMETVSVLNYAIEDTNNISYSRMSGTRGPTERPDSPFQNYVDALVVGSGLGKVFFINGPARLHDVKDDKGVVLMEGNKELRTIRKQLTDAADTHNERKNAEQITVRMPFEDATGEDEVSKVKVKFYAIKKIDRKPKDKTGAPKKAATKK